MSSGVDYAFATKDYVDNNSGSGDVAISGSPEANDIARFTDGSTIEGLSYAETLTALGVVVTPSSSDTRTISDGDTTPDLTGGETVVTSGVIPFVTANTTSTTISDVDMISNGKAVIRVADNNTTFEFSGANLEGNGGNDYDAVSGDVILFICTEISSTQVKVAFISTADYSEKVSQASQGEMEAGTSTAVRQMTPQRVKQAIDALAPASTAIPTVDTEANLISADAVANAGTVTLITDTDEFIINDGTRSFTEISSRFSIHGGTTIEQIPAVGFEARMQSLHDLLRKTPVEAMPALLIKPPIQSSPTTQGVATNFSNISGSGWLGADVIFDLTGNPVDDVLSKGARYMRMIGGYAQDRQIHQDTVDGGVLFFEGLEINLGSSDEFNFYPADGVTNGTIVFQNCRITGITGATSWWVQLQPKNSAGWKNIILYNCHIETDTESVYVRSDATDNNVCENIFMSRISVTNATGAANFKILDLPDSDDSNPVNIWMNHIYASEADLSSGDLTDCFVLTGNTMTSHDGGAYYTWEEVQPVNGVNVKPGSIVFNQSREFVPAGLGYAYSNSYD